MAKIPDILMEAAEPEEDESIPEEFEMVDDAEEEDDEQPQAQPPVTQAEIAELRQKADNSSQLAQALTQIASRPGQASSAVPTPAPGESPEAFRKRMNESIFSSDDPYALIAEIAKREIAPIIGQTSHGAAALAKKIIEIDPEKGPTFKKYKKEVEEFVASLPPAQQALPQVWEFAHSQVLVKHSEEIATERATKIAEEMVDKRLKQLGLNPEKLRDVSFSETGGVAKPSPSTRRRVIKYTAADKAAADRKGLLIEDYMTTKRGR